METIIPYESVEDVMNDYNNQKRSNYRRFAERYASRIVMDFEREFGIYLNEQTLINYLLHGLENS